MLTFEQFKMTSLAKIESDIAIADKPRMINKMNA